MRVTRYPVAAHHDAGSQSAWSAEITFQPEFDIAARDLKKTAASLLVLLFTHIAEPMYSTRYVKAISQQVFIYRIGERLFESGVITRSSPGGR